MKEIILNVEGMACEGCENRIQNSLKNNACLKDIPNILLIKLTFLTI